MKGEVGHFALMHLLMASEIPNINDGGDIKRYKRNLRKSNILSPALTQWPSLKLIIFHFLSMKRLCVRVQKGKASFAFHTRRIDIGTSLRTSIHLHNRENWMDVV